MNINVIKSAWRRWKKWSKDDDLPAYVSAGYEPEHSFEDREPELTAAIMKAIIKSYYETNPYNFLLPEEASRLALKKHIESLPDWMMDQIRWCMTYLVEDSSKINWAVQDEPMPESGQMLHDLFSKEADRQFEHQPIKED